MQKYKVVASKSQKKYTLVLSADSESQVKEKLHKEDYSILSVALYDESKDITGGKFLFQIQKDGEIKNGVIVWKDIFKVYVKLRDELWYDVLFIYPEWDEAHTNAAKKQEIISELRNWYDIQKKQIKVKQEEKQAEENFYMKKRLDETYKLIKSAVSKFDNIFSNKAQYNIDDDTFYKLEKVYEKLIHIKWSTNIVKLREIWELALVKIWEVELKSVEATKNKESRELLKETNQLLKKIGSSNQFIEADKDFKRKIINLWRDFIASLSLDKMKEDIKNRKVKKELIDKESYSFLKTILLLDKYKEKLRDNTKEIFWNISVFLNPFSQSETREKILLKRKVIRQNISILRAKKSGSLWSYTWVKKWYKKVVESFFSFLEFLSQVAFLLTLLYVFMFLSVFSSQWVVALPLNINSQSVVSFLLLLVILYVFSVSRKLFFFALNLVFFGFVFIFFSINF